MLPLHKHNTRVSTKLILDISSVTGLAKGGSKLLTVVPDKAQCDVCTVGDHILLSIPCVNLKCLLSCITLSLYPLPYSLHEGTNFISIIQSSFFKENATVLFSFQETLPESGQFIVVFKGDHCEKAVDAEKINAFTLKATTPGMLLQNICVKQSP